MTDQVGLLVLIHLLYYLKPNQYSQSTLFKYIEHLMSLAEVKGTHSMHLSVGEIRGGLFSGTRLDDDHRLECSQND